MQGAVGKISSISHIAGHLNSNESAHSQRKVNAN